MKKITILTATYNRAHTLERLFNSLTCQTFIDFDWLVIDDGSIDNTNSIITQMIKTNPPFSIKYFLQENGGKHRAINTALNLLEGGYIYIVDSDDFLPTTSVETIVKWIDSLNGCDKKFIGVSGLKAYPNNSIVGKTFVGDYIDCTDLERHKFMIKGDKAEVYKLDELKKYRFPEIEGEKFMTEAILWNRIAKDGYYLRHFNEVVYYCEYLEDGLTKNIDRNYIKSLKGYTLYTKELIRYNLPLGVRVKAMLSYCYRAKLKGLHSKEIAKNLGLPKYKIIIFIIIASIYKMLLDLKG